MSIEADKISFKGKHVLVTGAELTLARTLATVFQDNGANVMVTFNDDEYIEAFRKFFPKIQAIQVDLSDWEETILELGGRVYNIDYLVNCCATLEANPVGLINESEIDRMFAYNFKSAVNVIQLVSLGMKSRKFGSIVNISSTAGIAALEGMAMYGCTKSALDMFTKVTAKELAPFNIRVNSVNPLTFNSEVSKKTISEMADLRIKKDFFFKQIPFGKRSCTFDEVVGPVIFMLSDYAGMITGTVLPIDGGYTAC